MLRYVGLFCLSFLSYQFFHFLALHLRSSSLHRYNYSKDGQKPWAFISGSSDGIGRGFARELARSGFNIILHGRNPTKLENVRQALAAEFPQASFRIVVADVCESESQVLRRIDAIVEELRDLHLTVLVNNVGGAPPRMEPLYKPLEAYLPRDIDGMISMNLRFTAHLTRALLPLLIGQNPSLIINIGSMADVGLPWLSMYSGAKAFVMAWSTALGREMKVERKNVEVLGIRLMTVTDTSFRKEIPTIMQPDARTFAEACLQKVGCGRLVVTGYWAHDVMLSIVSLLPEKMVLKISSDSIKKEAEKDKKRD
ncbi:hypothetical protein BDV59DRAFT_180528 [Aspergillus ambiguus]|uniref:putative short chain dehydrogenase/reductase n=1 Tax=Aspergillus ambiguus TaxID=176160 RepID=UPI003CCDB8F0